MASFLRLSIRSPLIRTARLGAGVPSPFLKTNTLGMRQTAFTQMQFRSIHSAPVLFSNEADKVESATGTPFEQVNDVFSLPDGVSSVLATSADVVESSWYGPVDLTVMALDNIHAMTGLPWWLSIVGTTFVMRTLLLPLGVKVWHF